MITVSEALVRIRTHVATLESEVIPLGEALHRVVAEDLYSYIDMPPFPQSAMDGYAVHLHDDANYTLIGEIKAGDAANVNLQAGQAVRIFTGAMVPESANCVVRQEIVERSANSIVVRGDLIAGENVRPRGEQISKGQLVAENGTRLNPGMIGYLGSLGHASVRVYRKPVIALIATGNELQQAGTALEPGKIYESNSLMLRSALQQLGFDCQIHFVKDDYTSTRDLIAHCLTEVDLLLLSGGISVGDYDFVERALTELDVRCHFYKVRQKPGKPLYFGSRNAVTVFALPGNPAAALTCFYVYVRLALDTMQNYRSDSSLASILPLAEPFGKKSGLTHFLKAKASGGQVQILPAQSSAMLSAFAEANCLVIADEEREQWLAGEEISFIPLPV